MSFEEESEELLLLLSSSKSKEIYNLFLVSRLEYNNLE